MGTCCGKHDYGEGHVLGRGDPNARVRPTNTKMARVDAERTNNPKPLVQKQLGAPSSQDQNPDEKHSSKDEYERQTLIGKIENAYAELHEDPPFGLRAANLDALKRQYEYVNKKRYGSSNPIANVATIAQ